MPEQASEQPAQLKVTANADKLRRPNRSSTDGQARLAQKPGKPFRLYYLSSMARFPAGIDTAHQVITHIQAAYAAAADRR